MSGRLGMTGSTIARGDSSVMKVADPEKLKQVLAANAKSKKAMRARAALVTPKGPVVKRSSGQDSDHSGTAVGSGAVLGGTGLFGGGIPGARPNSGRLAHVRRGSKFEGSRHLVSATRGGVFGYRADAHQRFLNRQNADEVVHGGKKTTRINHFLRGRGTGKIVPEDQIIRHMKAGRAGSNVALIGGAALLGTGIHQRKKLVDKRDNYRNDALIAGGATTAGLTGGGSLLLDSQGRKWSKGSAASLKAAHELNPKVGGHHVRQKKGNRVPDVVPDLRSDHIAGDHKKIFAGRSSKHAESVGRLRGLAGQQRYFGATYGKIAGKTRKVGAAGALVGAAGLGAKHLQGKPQEVDKKFVPRGLQPRVNIGPKKLIDEHTASMWDAHKRGQSTESVLHHAFVNELKALPAARGRLVRTKSSRVAKARMFKAPSKSQKIIWSASGAAAAGGAKLASGQRDQSHQKRAAAAGGAAGVAGTKLGLDTTGWTAREHIQRKLNEVNEARVSRRPKRERKMMRRHRASVGMTELPGAKTPNAYWRKYPLKMPMGAAQRVMGWKNNPVVVGSTLTAGGIAGARHAAKPKEMASKAETSMSDAEAAHLAGKYDTKGPLPKGLSREHKMKAYEARYIASGGKTSEKWHARSKAAEIGRSVGLAGATGSGAVLLGLKSKRVGRAMGKIPGIRKITPHHAETAGLTSAVGGGASEIYGERARKKRASYLSSPGGVAASALTRMRNYTPDKPGEAS